MKSDMNIENIRERLLKIDSILSMTEEEREKFCTELLIDRCDYYPCAVGSAGALVKMLLKEIGEKKEKQCT